MWTTVDLFDTDQVMDVVIDQMNHFIVEEHLALWVIPIRSAAKEAEVVAANRANRLTLATGD